MPASIVNEAFIKSFASSIAEIDQAEALPPACYTDRDFWEFEKEAVFYREWLCVGREAWVKNPGDYYTTAHVGEPILVVRDAGGTLRAMSSVCRHRGMLVAEGCGNARAFTCPYHHWSYGLDGKLLGAPAMDKACGFDAKQVRLPQLRLESWLGFVFVNFDADAAPLEPRLAALSDALQPYDLAHADEPAAGDPPVACPWNWKVQLENSNDGYHANRLHKGPVHDLCPSGLSVFPELPENTAGYFRYNGTTGMDVGFNPTKKAILPVFPRLTEEERSRFVFANVPPTFQLMCRPDWATFTIFHAETAEEMSFTRGWMVAPGAMREPLFKERLDIYFATSAAIGEQDRWVDAKVQIGLRSKFAPRGRYSWQERAQRDLNNWLVPRYRACWEKNAQR